MVAAVRTLAHDRHYDAVSIGYPGPVLDGTILHDPKNLGGGWVGFDFQAAFGRPVKVINDAAMQALGSYRGGRMLFLGLGTGLGSAMVLAGTVLPMELAHLPYKKKMTFEDYVGARGLKRLGKKKWRRGSGCRRRLSARRAGLRLRRPGRRQCRAPQGAARGHLHLPERECVRGRLPDVGLAPDRAWRP